MERGKGGRGLAARRRSSVPAARPERIPPSSQSDARARIARPIVVAVLSLASAVAIGQERPDAGQILQQQREPLRLPPPPDDDVRPRPPEPKPALPVSPTLKVQVTKFTF